MLVDVTRLMVQIENKIASLIGNECGNVKICVNAVDGIK